MTLNIKYIINKFMGSITRFDIQSYKDRYNLTYFIETGTLYGDSVAHAAQFDFEKIFSFEVYKPLYEKSKERFINDQRIVILNEDSGKGIENLNTQVKGNALFFLDAHFPGADAGYTQYNEEKNNDTKMPLLNELKGILNRASEYKDVIIIDDYRIFEVDHRIQYADVDGHLKSIGKGDIKRTDLVHFNLMEFLQSTFSEYFNIDLDFRDEGYVVLTHR